MDDRRPDPTQDTWSQWLPDLESPQSTAATPAGAPAAPAAPGSKTPVGPDAPPTSPPTPPPAASVPLPPPANRVDPLPYAATPIAEWVGPRPGQAPPPSTRLGWAILCTIFCFTPFGIVAIVKSTQVSPKWALGDWDGARAASQSVKTWCLLAAATWPGSFMLFSCMGMVGGGHVSIRL
ncbi:CD225/dispanin family protein [Terrabacter sp. C0L_2]|uniref:CD225/dispanin family protein n=1 Tax=Terrabacter sp. C0L_2 TaxID=3108389 RepID=UPI002ED559C4|nr:CD225/dispanin family protein [Terrabacter sp. C0L_2]